MKKTNKYLFLLICVLISILLNIFASLISDLLDYPPVFLPQKSKIALFIDTIIIAPFLETLIFQVLVIELSNKFFPNKYLITIILSGILFGSAHYFNDYNLIYAFITFLMGLYFAVIYLISKKRKDISPFLVVFITHLSVNFLYFIANIGI